MTRYASPAVRGEKPWGRNEGSGLDEAQETAPSKQVAYLCEKGHEFTVTLAESAVPRADWDCRCGSVAHLDGAPDGAPAQAGRPGYGEPPGGYRKGDKAEGMDPWGQLMKRRSIPALEKLLAERLAELKKAGAPQ